MPAFADLGAGLGVDYAQFRPLLRLHGRPDPGSLVPGQIADMALASENCSTQDYRVLSSEHKYRMIAEGRAARPYDRCYGQNFAAVIGADLRMYVCCHMRGVRRFILGELKRRTVSEIWASSERRRAVNAIDLSKCPPLCRCDSFNRILWEIKAGRMRRNRWPSGEKWQHENFI
ncbi:MAG: SPASM domain-containing protein [bacterium]